MTQQEGKPARRHKWILIAFIVGVILSGIVLWLLALMVVENHITSSYEIFLILSFGFLIFLILYLLICMLIIVIYYLVLKRRFLKERISL